MTSKYQPIGDLLRSLTPDTGTATILMSEIDKAVGGLPDTAWRDRSWWFNSKSSSRAQSWLKIGWRVSEVDFERYTVTFIRSLDKGRKVNTAADLLILDNSAKYSDRVDEKKKTGSLRASLQRRSGVLLTAILTVAASYLANEISNTANFARAIAAFGAAVVLTILVGQSSAKPNSDEPDTATSRRRLHRVIGVGALVAVAGAALAYSFWPTMPVRADYLKVLIHDDFNSPGSGWQVGRSPSGLDEYESGNYRIVANRGYAVWSTAPAVQPAAHEQIIAVARLADGEGGWGVWCRGTGTGQRYEFSVTHAGFAYIKTPYHQTIPKEIPDFDAYQDNRVVADCSDTSNRKGVQLKLSVDGKLIVSYLDHDPTLLGPGEVGIHAFTFGDVNGDLADARFSDFEVDELPSS